MNRMGLDDDIFSPVRFDASIVDSSGNSDGSLTDFLNTDSALSFSNTVDNKGTSNENKLQRQSKLQSIDQGSDSFSICSPVSTENPRTLLDNKFYSGSTDSNIEKKKHIENKLIKQSSEKFQPALSAGTDTDSHAPKPNSTKQINLKRRSNQVPILPSKDELVKHNVLKDEKKKQKSTVQSLKNIGNRDESKSKLSAEKKLMDNSLNLTVNSSEKSLESKASTTTLGSVSTVKPNNAVKEAKNAELANSGTNEYEASIERMVHECITFESAKLRQNMYIQQMCFYRQLNQVKNEMQQQHLATTQRLFKIIDELKQINGTLRSALNDKN